MTGEFFAAYPFIAITLAVLALYVDMSAGQFLRIFAVWAAFQLLYTALVARRIRREAAPITDWLRGYAILLAENVKRLLQDHAVELEARPGVKLKGKREPIMLYAPRGRELVAPS